MKRLSTNLIIVVMSIASLVLFIVGAAMLFTWVSKTTKETAPTIQYEEEIISRASADMNMEFNNAKLIFVNQHSYDYLDYDVYKYILIHDEHAYLVGVQKNEYEIHYVDVEEQIL